MLLSSLQVLEIATILPLISSNCSYSSNNLDYCSDSVDASHCNIDYVFDFIAIIGGTSITIIDNRTIVLIINILNHNVLAIITICGINVTVPSTIPTILDIEETIKDLN